MKKLFRKVRNTVKKVTSSKAGRFAAPLAVGAMPYLLAKGAVSATSRRGGSVFNRARRFGHGAAGGAVDYFRNPVVRAAGEVLPGVKPLSRATERFALTAQRNLDPRRKGPISARDVAQSGAELGYAAASAAGYELPPAVAETVARGRKATRAAKKATRAIKKARRAVESGREAAKEIERGSRSRKNLRRARAGARALQALPFPARGNVRRVARGGPALFGRWRR